MFNLIVSIHQAANPEALGELRIQSIWGEYFSLSQLADLIPVCQRRQEARLRITFLLTQSLESPGGGGRYLPLARALVQRGYSVVLIALHHNYAEAPQRNFTVDGIAVKYVGQMHVRKSGNVKTYFNPVTLLWVAFMATVQLFWAAFRTPADAIHVCKTQPMNGVAAWLVHLLRRIPVFLDSDDYEAVNNRFAHAWQQRFVAWFENWMPGFASGITAGTTYIAERFASRGFPPEKIIIVPNGVDRARFAVLQDETVVAQKAAQLRQKWQIGDGHRVIVYVGSMSLVSHAVDLLLESFQLVLQREPNALLLLAGAGEDLPRLQQMAHDLAISDCVRFVGRVPLAEIPYCFHLGVLAVDPMRRSIPAESSLSLKLLESMAAGTPCVTADIGDRRAVVNGAGLAVAPDDVDALAEGILHILQHPETAVAMRQRAIALREQNWWDQRVDLFIKQYKLLENHT